MREVIKFAWFPVCIEDKIHWFKFYKESQINQDIYCYDTGIFMYTAWYRTGRKLIR